LSVLSCSRSLWRALQSLSLHVSSFSFTSTAPTDLYTLSLHDALPISRRSPARSSSRSATRTAASSPMTTGSRRACWPPRRRRARSEEHTSELQSRENLVCRLLLEKKKISTTLKLLLNAAC